MKTNRHEKILELIKKYPVTTQEELIEYLSADGYDVTQSTVSRDIKQLRLTKALMPDGKYRYRVPDDDARAAHGNFSGLLTASLISADSAMNMVVLKTYAGMANAACAAIDAVKSPAIVGTIAGDDTIFVVCRDEESALSTAEEFKKYIS